MSSSSNLLFVYGTLLSGQTALPDWQKRAGAILLGRAKARGRLYSFGRYPGAVFDSRCKAFVRGELYRLKNEGAFDFLDHYEEVDPVDNQDRAFAREIIVVETEGGRSTPAWAYLFTGSVEGRPLIQTGDWLRFTRR